MSYSSVLKFHKPDAGFGLSNLFGSRSNSQTGILCKKIDIVTSPHLEEPEWDIVMSITDALNNDSGRAKRVLAHLKKIFERSFAISLDNQQLFNCLTVIDSFFRNGNKNIISVLHSQFLTVLAKLAKKADTDEKQRSLLQSNKKTCRDRVLSIIKQWADDERISQSKYPQFRSLFIKLKFEGLPFDQISDNKQSTKAAKTEIVEEKEMKNNCSNNNDHNSPWLTRHLSFAKWYKKKLKTDLFQIIEQLILFQDLLSMGNTVELQFLCLELRETHHRLISLMLRCPNPGSCDSIMQLVIIISSLLGCAKDLSQGKRCQIPGISKTGLTSIISSLFERQN